VTAAEIARAVRGRSTTARATIEAALERIAGVDGRLGAFTELVAERAAQHAGRIDAGLAAGRDPGPLAGVPFAAKNLFDVAGIVTRAGAKVTAGSPPATRDADAVAAFEAQGAVLVGVTNMDEFAYGFVTENAHDGTTRNPHDLDRIAGGSSGGSAAAVGAGLVPLALASDTNGSIRVPAALCGIFGIRPTHGKLSRRGAFPFAASLDTVGPLARTAADLWTAFAALDPQTTRDAGDVGALRAARLGGYFAAGSTPEAQQAVTHVCRALGAVEEIVLDEAERARESAFIITSAEGGELHAQRLRSSAADFDPATRDRLIAGSLLPAAWYIRAQRFRSWFRERIGDAFARADVLVAPATPYAATRAGQRTLLLDGAEIEIRPNLGVFTQPLSLAGVPVVTVPVIAAGALPLGVQLVGRPGSEAALLALAIDLERRGIVGARELPALAASSA
jgi:aspartyl-tRNA(Asn)/glutamyl-tRNA(Gln) amidotransferase subunit A